MKPDADRQAHVTGGRASVVATLELIGDRRTLLQCPETLTDSAFNFFHAGTPKTYVSGTELENLGVALGDSSVALARLVDLIDTRTRLQSHAVDGDVAPILLFLSVIRCLVDACWSSIEKSLANATTDNQNQQREPHEMRVVLRDVLEANLTFAISMQPFERPDSFSKAFENWLRQSLIVRGVPNYVASAAAKECYEHGRNAFRKVLRGDSNIATRLRDFLAISKRPKSSLRVIGSLRSLDESLLKWIDVVDGKEQRREAWNDYLETLRRLPDAAETMFNERFGVRNVFQPPIIEYHVNGHRRDGFVQPDLVYDIGRLLGGLISNRVRSEDLIILSGGPGSGKSTLCRFIASRLASISDMHPVFLRLRKVKEGTDVTSFIEESLHRNGLIDRLSDLRTVPNLVLILDGFDELVMSSRGRLRQFFNILRDELSAGPLRHAKIIVSGRDTLFPGGEGLPSGSHVLSLRPFDRRRVEAWGSMWRRQYSSGPGSTFFPENLMQIPGSTKMQNSDHPLTHLITWPLTLHLLAQIHTAGRLNIGSDNESIEKAYLYRSILSETTARQVQQTAGEGRLDSSRMRDFIRALAWEMYERSTDSLDPVDAGPLLSRFYPDKTEAELSELADVAVVNAPELTRGEETGFEFVHKSFSEFLVAEHIADSVEHVIYKAPDYNSIELTWRMGDVEATSKLSSALAIRPLPSEVQEMLEPMLGVLRDFSRGDRVDDDVDQATRVDGLLRLLDRFGELYRIAVRGGALAIVSLQTADRIFISSPLEAYANYCSGLMLIGSAGGRRLTRVPMGPGDRGAASLFQCEPVAGSFWRFLAILQAGGMAIDGPLARRLFLGATVAVNSQTNAAHEQLADVNYPINFGYLQHLDGYIGSIAEASSHAALDYIYLHIVRLVDQVSRRDQEFDRYRFERYEHRFDPFERFSGFPELMRLLGSVGLASEIPDFDRMTREIVYLLERASRDGDPDPRILHRAVQDLSFLSTRFFAEFPQGRRLSEEIRYRLAHLMEREDWRFRERAKPQTEIRHDI